MLHINDTNKHTKPAHGSDTSAYRQRTKHEIKRGIEIRKWAHKQNGFAEASKRNKNRTKHTQNKQKFA